MREQLLAIFNTLKLVETRGESTLMLGDCMRELAKIINNMPNEEAKEETND